MNYTNDIFNIFLPETCLIFFIIGLTIAGMFINIKHYKFAKWISLLGIVISVALCSEVQIEPLYSGFSDAIISDNFTIYFKGLILISSFMTLLLTKKCAYSRASKTFQFYSLFLSAVLGCMILVASNDFITMLISLELISFSTFFLCSYDKNYQSKEATFKYLLTNALATTTFLFGVSFVYGMTGSLNFTDIQQYFLQNPATLIFTMGSTFIVLGILYKLAILPFNNWILDVYEGAPTSIVAFLSVVPKVAVFGVFARLLVFVLSNSLILPVLLIVLATITTIWANTLAVRQKNIKRLLACSSSANAAYMLFAISLVSVFNLSSVLFYLTVYAFMNIGIFSAIIILENSDFSNKLHEFKNFAYSNPMFTFCFSICLMGLAGLPITSGFIGKIYIFSAISRAGFEVLPFLIIVFFTIVIAMFYYLNVIKLMFEKDKNIKSEVLPARTGSATLILYFCTFITILLGIAPSKIIEICQIIAYNI